MKQGKAGAAEVAALIEDAESSTLGSAVREALLPLVEQLRHTEERVARLEQMIVEWHKNNATSLRLASLPASVRLRRVPSWATITDARLFSSGRHLAAWIGLVPRQNSSGGKERLGGITKKGDGYIANSWLSAQCGPAVCPERQPELNEVGEQSPDEEAAQGRGRRIGEQDGTDQLGAPGSQ